ncbi:MAG: hypothetical protein IPL60_12145 [Ardenticatenia bacterium]|nr:hypothetical protein [Ardenticatenia bacterium]
MAGDARSPYLRQAASTAARETATAALLVRLRGPRGRLLRWLLGGAQTFAPLREDALADVGLGSLLRRKLLAIGARAVASGAPARRRRHLLAEPRRSAGPQPRSTPARRPIPVSRPASPNAGRSSPSSGR